MSTPHELFSIINSALSGPFTPTPTQRIQLMHSIRSSLPLFQSLLCYPGPNASDRAQVQSKEVRLPDSPLISLDDVDVQIAFKLSDDLNLNEIDCIRLLVYANKEWILFGRDPLEIYRLAAGLWYMERRSVITSLHTLLRAVVLDQGLEADLLSDIQKYLEEIFNSGLRQRLTALIKELNREEPAGFGGPHAERYVIDFRGAAVERKAVVAQEKLLLSHCLVLSVLVWRMGPKDVKDAFTLLRDCAVEVIDNDYTIKFQITISLMFSLVISFVSDALSSSSSKASLPCHDFTFRKEFHKLVMTLGNNPYVEGFIDVVRLAWALNLIYAQDLSTAREASTGMSTGSDSRDLTDIYACLESIRSRNVFQFVLAKVLQTASYQNEDEDIVYIYDGYMHKLMMCFLSHPFTRTKVKEMKEKAMNALDPYIQPRSDHHVTDTDLIDSSVISQPFVSILELVSEIYKRQPELLLGNEDLWTFVNFAGEDHTNIPTLVAFLGMLKTLASTEEGASKVFELLQGKTFRRVGWATLFDCLSIYDEKFRHSLESSGASLPDIQEGDAKALVAYLNVLQKVVENGDPTERKKWFPDIEPLFKLLSYENVPPYLKGALRDAISSFIGISPIFKDTIWSYLEKYDLPVVVGPLPGTTALQLPSQVYDMRFELNEVEARRENYPSTISFLNLLNELISQEKDVSDRGRRFVGIFRFVYDHVFGPFPQRAYADPAEKWQLIIACLQHFHLVLSMYDICDEDISNATDLSEPWNATLEIQLPILELLKDFMSGKVVYRNIMGIIMMGVNTLINDRISQSYGILFEKAIRISLEIIVLVFERDILLAEYWRPLYQPLDIILSQDHNHIVSLLEYVRYDFLPQIQLCSIKIASILSSRMAGLVQLLLKANAAKYITEDYAACLETRFDESMVVENTKDDPGVLIMQLLIDNVSHPSPNITHLLLKFDVDGPVEKAVLQPKYHFSCLKVILDNLEKLLKPEINALLYEFGFQLVYELCLDPLTAVPIMDLLSTKKYQFFSKHLNSLGVAPLPKRTSNQALRISTLHQRAWLLKLLAFELHSADMSESLHRETCTTILSQTFGQYSRENSEPNLSRTAEAHVSSFGYGTSKIEALEMLEIVQFRPPDIALRYSQLIPNMKYHTLVEEVLSNPATSETGGVYYYSERGDRLIDLDAFHERLRQMFKGSSPQEISRYNEAEKGNLREAVQQLLRWAWKYNKNLEEHAAQLHMLTGWSQMVEVSISRKMLFLEDRCHILVELLEASLSASASPDCSLRMALILSNVALTCMAKLRDERFLCPGGSDSDSVTCLDIVLVKHLPNGAYHSILFKLMLAILRNESSEALRRRQYALLLIYFQYCQSILDPEIPASVLDFLLREEQGDDDLNLQKIDNEQAELARANFSILKKEAQAVIAMVSKDAIEGSEACKAMSFYVLDVFISIDQERFFLGLLQSMEILRSSLLDISNFSCKDGRASLETLQRLCTLEAQLALLLRISYRYNKHGAQILLSIAALEHLGSCRVMDLQTKGLARHNGTVLVRGLAGEVDRQRLLLTPILRLVSSLTSLVDFSEFLEVKNKIVREVLDFVKCYQLAFDQILREDISTADDDTLERIYLVVSILSRIWPYEENDEYGFLQGLLSMMNFVFDNVGSADFVQLSDSVENKSNTKLIMFRLCFSLLSYLYLLITKKLIRLQVSDSPAGIAEQVGPQQPTLLSLAHLLDSLTINLVRAGEEKVLLLNKIQNINELSRQEVDEIIDVCNRQDCLSSYDNIRKRRYIAMVEMCHMAGNRDKLIVILLQLTECLFNILLIHFHDDNTNLRDLSFLFEKLHPNLERLELLREDKIGHNLKLFHRMISSLKEISIRNMDL